MNKKSKEMNKKSKEMNKKNKGTVLLEHDFE